MRRVIGLLVHNWPLKVAAILLATLLYGGLVVSENAQVWRGRVAIIPLRQPTTAVLLGSIPDVTSIRYFAPLDVATRLSSDSFTATIDLADATVSSGAPFVSVRVLVAATDPRVRILDYEPQVVRVQLDPLITKTVPIQVERGPVPPGLAVREPVVDPATATVSGPESIVRLVAAAQARVVIQPSGLDVDQQVDLVAVDAAGDVLTPVDIEPGAARVRIQVGSQLVTRTLPIRVRVAGVPAPGWEVATVEVQPAVILVEGEADLLAPLASVVTAPVDIEDATDELVATAELLLPDGVRAIGIESVRVVVRLREATGTRSLQIAVVPAGGTATGSYSLSADRITVVLSGPVAALNALDPADLVALVDVADLRPGTYRRPIRVTAPAGLVLASLAPATVEVTVAGSAP